MRSRTLIYGGLALAGLYAVFKNQARAGVAPSGSAAALPDGGGGATDYTPAALNASVPGVSFAASTLQPGVLASTLTGVPALTGSQTAQSATFWNTLQPVNPPDSGYVTLPSGAQVAAATMTGGNTRMDGNGNYYVLWGGQVYQLGSMDSAGNWPALPVTGG